MVLREAEALAPSEALGCPPPHFSPRTRMARDRSAVTLTSALPAARLAPGMICSPGWTRLASTQAVIHTVPSPLQIRWDGRMRTERVRWSGWADRGLRDAAREAASGPLVDEKVLIHGDYQHFNVLWCAGDSAASWTGERGNGHRGSDVATAVLNLAVLFGRG